MRWRALYFIGFLSFLFIAVGNFSQVRAQSFATQSIVTRSVDGGTVPKSQTPSFDWTAVSGATSYTLEICKAEFTATFLCPTGSLVQSTTLIPTNSYTPTVELPRKIVLYWHVRAVSTIYGLGPWSASSNFLSPNAPPKPVASLPAATVIQSTSPTLTWSTTVSALTPPISTYDIQFCSTSTCAAGSIISTTTNGGSDPGGSTATLLKRTWQVSPALQNATQYYWRVRTKDSGSQASGWSATLGLKTVVAAASLNGPADGTDLTSTTPTFSWDAVPSAGTYAILLSKTGQNGTYTALTGATALPATTTSFTPTADIGKPTAPETRLYWKVRTTTTAYSLSDSIVRNMIPAQAPTPPVLTQFAAVQSTQRPVFKWSSTKIATTLTPAAYELQIATDSAFSQNLLDRELTQTQANCVQTGTTTLTFTCTYTIDTNLNTGSSYFWRVRAETGTGSSDDSSAWTVNLATAPLKIALINPPNLSSPSNGSTVDLATPTFTWGAVNGALTYTVQLCKVAFTATGTCSSLVVAAATVTTNSYTPAVALPTTIPIYWNVKANSTLYLNTLFSNSFNFTSAGAPLPPTLTAFVGAQSPNPIFKWSSTKTTVSLQPNAYELQIATDAAFTQNLTTKELNRSSLCTQTGTTTLTFACTYTLDTSLQNGSSYFWRVRSEIGTAATDDASAWVTNAVASPLKINVAKPALVSPISGADVGTTIPTFTWNVVPGATTYAVKRLVGTVWTVIAGTQTVNGGTVSMKPTAAVTTTPILGGDISWQVVATSTLYGTATSGTGVFTSAASPTAPVLIQFPATAQTTLTPTFKWSSTKTAATLDPTTYELQLASDTAFTQNVITKSLTRAQANCTQTGTTTLTFACAYPIDQNLASATTYQWRVRAKASTGDASAWVSNLTTAPLKIGLIGAPTTGAPTVTAALSANPTPAETNQPVTLTASVTGTATGTISYEYRCKATDAFSSITSNNTSTCTYTAAGSYVATVRATRQGIADTADSQTIVITIPTVIPTPTPVPEGTLNPSAKVMNVLEIRYMPTSTPPYPPDELSAELQKEIRLDSRFQGYRNGNTSPNGINVSIKKLITVNGPRPNGDGTPPGSINQTFTDLGVCSLINTLKIDQVWIWTDANHDGSPQFEYYLSSKYIDDKWMRDVYAVHALTPFCNGDRGIAVLGLYYSDGFTISSHIFGHMSEGMFSYLFGRELFWNRWAGLVPGSSEAKTCGTVHFAPNSTADYEYSLTNSVSSKCQNWKPDGSGTATTLSCTTWGCTQGGYYRWWQQNIPGLNNTFQYSGKTLPNFYSFLSDFDKTLEDTRYNPALYIDPIFRNTVLAPKFMGTITEKTDTKSFTHPTTPVASKPLVTVMASYHSWDGTETTPGTATITSMTYGGKPMTKVSRQMQHQYGAEMWYLPPSYNSSLTNSTVSMVFATAAQGSAQPDSLKVTAVTLLGVNQTTPLRGTGVSIGAVAQPWGGAITHTLTVPSTSGDIILGMHNTFAGVSRPVFSSADLSPDEGVKTIDEPYVNTAQTINIALSGKSSVNLNWTTEQDPWEAIGISVIASP
ncbi:MAG: hypothetical protein ABI758_02230 [Candidatus Woesebacteria bacterium]